MPLQRLVRECFYRWKSFCEATVWFYLFVPSYGIDCPYSPLVIPSCSLSLDESVFFNALYLLKASE